MELDVALEADLRRELRRIERFDRGLLAAGPGDLLLDRLARAIRQAVVLGMDPEEGGNLRVGADRASESGLDEVVKPLVKWSGVRRWRRPAQLELV